MPIEPNKLNPYYSHHKSGLGFINSGYNLPVLSILWTDKTIFPFDISGMTNNFERTIESLKDTQQNCQSCYLFVFLLTKITSSFVIVRLSKYNNWLVDIFRLKIVTCQKNVSVCFKASLGYGFRQAMLLGNIEVK